MIAAPGTFAVLVPWLISHWHTQAPFFGFEATRWLGGLLILLGTPVVLEAFWRFAAEGLGTPAPIAPPQTLVVRGSYRYVRNPMYVALLAIIVGQALLLGDARLVLYAVVMWTITHLFIVFYEEPTLRKMFGAEYVRYCEHVGRWIPR